ncbi:MAG: UDP-N-acetylmuramoyl-L-alanyl-D-glutamate--2,6-diaminopimelate ligase [Lysobacterales bacterium CG02_land_8_20_14_3_00_62_12]|nr:MAG: UDP-N-acetylmuramoyl-L-alanyl-D-glutamate--2,6-diaminopimelate ligase [Xanthomonadales bacterium CG02_land_8_20_14_3_00_62_12]
MSALTLASLLDGLLPWPDPVELPIRGLGLDSRAIRAGQVFVARVGSQHHGLAFARQAISNGAVAVLYETPITTADRALLAGLGVPTIGSSELGAQLGKLAQRCYGSQAPRPGLIGITGTNGKTSSVQLLTQALHANGLAVGSIGTLGSGRFGQLQAAERTTPDVFATHAAIAEMRASGADWVAMEVSSHALVQGRVDGLRFTVAAFTNLSRDHLDFHGDMASYGAAKAKLFDWPALASAVIHIDDAFGRTLAAGITRARRITLSTAGNPAATFAAEGIRSDAHGSAFDLRHGNQRYPVQSRLLGRFNVANLLTVAGILSALDWPPTAIAAALCALDPVPGRMARLGGNATTPLIVIDYAHTPDALAKALASLREHTRGRLLLVFGCGGERDRGKRPQMGAIGASAADFCIVTDDNPRAESGDQIVQEILTGMPTAPHIHIQRDRRAAIRLAIAMAAANDTVLIAGKGHEAYQEVSGIKHPFDDLTEARAALEAAA